MPDPSPVRDAAAPLAGRGAPGHVLAVLVALLLPLAGCPPTCQQLCQKLDRCAFDATRTIAECRQSCDGELNAVKDSDADKEIERAYYEQRICLGQASCEEIAAGACYDELLFAF